MCKPMNFPGRKNLRRKFALERFNAELAKLLHLTKDEQKEETVATQIQSLKDRIAVAEKSLVGNSEAIRTKKNRTGLGKMGK